MTWPNPLPPTVLKSNPVYVFGVEVNKLSRAWVYVQVTELELGLAAVVMYTKITP